MLKIYTLGGLHLTLNDETVSFAARRAELLITYLAMQWRVHEREAIANMLWDDRTQKQTMANLRSLLAQLPKAVKPFIDATRKTITLTGEVWVDARQFEADSEGALALYKGDFLDGVFVTDSRGLEEWAAVLRERLRQNAFAAYEQAAQSALYERDYAAGVGHARRLVALDPLLERGWRLLMRLLVRDGQRNAALVEYDQLVQLLEDELGVAPSAETIRLYQRIEATRQLPKPNLPTQFTAFIGRKSEISQIARRLDDPACRLLTLHGVGGIGKTRLAVQLAEVLRSDFMHGVHFVSLATLQTGEQTLLHLADLLGLSLNSEQSPLEQLIAFLNEKEVLLIFDNVEHLVTALQPQIDTLLRRLPLLKMLVTSRTQLDLAAEWVMPIDGMAAQDESADAVQLFLTAAQRQRPSYALSDNNRAAILHICQLLRGMPLGIELAAAAHDSAENIASALTKNLDTIATTRYGIPDRHRSLRAAFNYSWQLLTDAEQTLLAQLSIFRAGFDRAAVAAVTQLGGSLDSLIGKALVQPLGDERFSLHPAIRQFSAENLTSPDQIQYAHSRYYGQLLTTLKDQLKDERQIAALATTEAAEANLKSGWRYAVAQADWSLIDQYLFALHKHLEAKSRYLQATTLFADALAQLRRAQSIDQFVLGRLLTYYGFHLERVGDYAQSEAVFDEATEYFRADAESADAADMLLTIASHRGMIAFNRGELKTAQTIYREAVALAMRYEDARALAHCLCHQGYVEVTLGEVESAESAFQQSITLWREIGAPRGLVIALNGLAVLYEEQGKLTEAQAIFEENLRVCEAAGDAMGEARTLQSLGSIAARQKDFTTARQHLERAITINTERIDNNWLESFLKSHLADVALSENALDEASQLFQEALAICEQEQDERGAAVCQLGLGKVALLRGEIAHAGQQLRTTLRHTSKTNWLPMTLNALAYLAAVNVADGDEQLAYQTAQLVANHPATSQPSREQAQKVLGGNSAETLSLDQLITKQMQRAG